MDKNKYNELYENEADISITDNDIVEWLDSIVIPLVQAQENKYDLCWGKLNNGSYSNRIAVCADDMAKVHIYEGIDRLAEAVGVKVSHKLRGADTKYPHEYYFMYKRAYVFEIRGDEDDD